MDLKILTVFISIALLYKLLVYLILDEISTWMKQRLFFLEIKKTFWCKDKRIAVQFELEVWIFKLQYSLKV